MLAIQCADRLCHSYDEKAGLACQELAALFLHKLTLADRACSWSSVFALIEPEVVCLCNGAELPGKFHTAGVHLSVRIQKAIACPLLVLAGIQPEPVERSIDRVPRSDGFSQMFVECELVWKDLTIAPQTVNRITPQLVGQVYLRNLLAFAEFILRRGHLRSELEIGIVHIVSRHTRYQTGKFRLISVKSMGLGTFSKDPGGCLKKIKYNEMVHMLRDTHPWAAWNDGTLSKKGRGVKIFE